MKRFYESFGSLAMLRCVVCCSNLRTGVHGQYFILGRGKGRKAVRLMSVDGNTRDSSKKDCKEYSVSGGNARLVPH